MKTKKALYGTALGLTILCMVLIRTQATTSSGNTVGDLSRAGLFTIALIGSAVMCDTLWKTLQPRLKDRRTVRHYDGSIRYTKKARTQAILEYEDITKAQDEQLHERERRRALYDRGYNSGKAQQTSQ